MEETMRTRVVFAMACLMLGLFSTAGHAVDETEYTLRKEFDEVLPIFMTGHLGDLAWIEGFSFQGTIYLGSTAIGSVTGEATLWNPPMNLQDAYDQVSMRITNTVDGVGTFEVYAQGVALGSSTSATIGDHIISWSGSLTNGTGLFNGYFGLSSGMVQANLNAGTASATEILLVRAGF
jgi:hypothetical protein